MDVRDQGFGIPDDRYRPVGRSAVRRFIHRHEDVPAVGGFLGIVEIDQIRKDAGHVAVDKIQGVTRCRGRRLIGGGVGIIPLMIIFNVLALDGD